MPYRAPLRPPPHGTMNGLYKHRAADPPSSPRQRSDRLIDRLSLSLYAPVSEDNKHSFSPRITTPPPPPQHSSSSSSWGTLFTLTKDTHTPARRFMAYTPGDDGWKDGGCCWGGVIGREPRCRWACRWMERSCKSLVITAPSTGFDGWD